MLRCVQCDTELVAPIRSEYWSDNHACHVWHCPKCCACFSSLVSFFDETDAEPVLHAFTLCTTAPAAWQYSPDPPCLIFREQLGRRAPADDFALGRETATAR